MAAMRGFYGLGSIITRGDLMFPIPSAGRRVAPLAALVLAVGVAGCSTGLVPNGSAQAGLGCVDDSSHCIDQRRTALNTIMADRERKWIRQPATPAAYASGVRLFAYKQRKKELSCEELAIGRREADAAEPTLRSAGGASLTPAQVSRGAMLGTEVSKELAAEIGRRCRT